MNTDTFWKIIESASDEVSDSDEIAGPLQRMLEELSAEEILGFQQELWRRLSESYRWDLWAVAYVVNGGCSDDGFEYFRGWLISQGRAYFEAALRDPVRAADRAEHNDANECEDVLYIAASVYNKKTGQRPPRENIQKPKEPAGTRWKEDELPELYPELHERFS